MSLIKGIQAEYHTTCFKLFIDYFENRLQTNRTKLDVAVGDEVIKLQGENRLIKELLKLRENRELKYIGKDGAYGR